MGSLFFYVNFCKGNILLEIDRYNNPCDPCAFLVFIVQLAFRFHMPPGI